MIDRPFKQIRDIFRENNKKNKELLKFVFEKSDSMSLWILGLSIGGISILANNIANAQKNIPHCSLKAILILLAVSVTTGIIYRVLYLRLFSIMNKIADVVDITFSTQKTMDTQSNLSGNETYEQLIVMVQNTTGENLQHLITMYIEANPDGKKILYDSMVDYYLKTVDFAKKDTELAIDFVFETYAKFSGMEKEKFKEKMMKEDLGLQLRNCLRWVKVCYICYLTTFIAALFIFALSA